MPAKDLLRKRTRSHPVLLLLGVILLGFLYHSYQPVYRLRTSSPSEFSTPEVRWDVDRRAVEMQTADAYWDRAVRFIQSRYPYGVLLPENPPEEFSIAKEEVRAGGLDFSPATRMRYWQRLRQVWILPQAWEKSHELNMDWLREFVIVTARKVERFVRQVLARFGP